MQRLGRTYRAVDKGLAAGKRLCKMLRLHAWRWNGRRYTSEPARPVQFSYGTLMRMYGRWRASGGNPEALALRWRPPVKVRKGHALDFARVCINSPARSFPEAFGRLSRSRATIYAYRLALGAKLLRRIVRLFSARRLVDCRTRKARATLNNLATGGAT